MAKVTVDLSVILFVFQVLLGLYFLNRFFTFYVFSDSLQATLLSFDPLLMGVGGIFLLLGAFQSTRLRSLQRRHERHRK